MRKSILLLALLWVGPILLRAQESDLPVTVGVTGFSHTEDSGSLLRQVLDVFEERLEVRQAFILEKDPTWQFMVAVKALSLENDDELVLSVMSLYAIPEEVIAIGGKQEVFYTNVSEAERATFPSDGAWVRQKVSEDFLRQFRMPQDHEILIVSREGLAAGIDALLDRFVAQHLHP